MSEYDNLENILPVGPLKIAALEGGVGALCTTSGQAASLLAVLNICTAGDHFVAASTIYGGTVNLFAVTLKKFGIECTFVDADAPEEEIEKAFRPNTKALFGETIANPAIAVLDLEKFARTAHSRFLWTTPLPRLCCAVPSSGARISWCTPPRSTWTAMPSRWAA